jgi:chromosome segregation ATPase
MEQNSILSTEQKPRKVDKKYAVLCALILALGGANIHAIRQANRAHERLDQVRQSLEARIASVNERAQAFGAQAEQAAALLQRQLQETHRSATSTAERRTAQLVGKLEAEHHQQQAAIASEIGEVKQAASAASQKVASVAEDVNTVRGDVAQTRSELANTRGELKAELRSVKGDLGIQSGLIATNARELTALRELGERHYYEFAVAKTGRPYKIASISVILRKTDPKRSKFTLDVLADDKRVEKKDKNLNEPVQFYVAGERQPYELVVNQVKKDQVVGYLAVPKVLAAAAR